MHKILLIIPAYNEESNILKTCNDIKSQSENYDFCVINDGSTDQTQRILEENNLNNIKLIHNLGIGGAVQTGYKYALENKYDIAIQFDGDGQHDASYIPTLIEPILNNDADFIIGSRFIDDNSDFKSTGTRRIGIYVISSLIQLLTRKKITDPTSGFRAANKDIIKLFANNYPQEYPEPETIMYLLKTNKKVVEVPVSMNERVGGVSSITSWKTVYYMVNVCLSIIINSRKG